MKVGFSDRLLATTSALAGVHDNPKTITKESMMTSGCSLDNFLLPTNNEECDGAGTKLNVIEIHRSGGKSGG